jgi:hypothetical protein
MKNFLTVSIFTKIVLGSFIFCMLILPLAVSAQQPNASTAKEPNASTKPAETFTLKNPLKVDSVGGLVQNFVEIFSYIVILFAVLAIIWVGFQFIIARGNATRMSELKDWLLWIVVGVAVVIGARIIIQVVINTLAATGTVDERTIQSVQKANSGN